MTSTNKLLLFLVALMLSIPVLGQNINIKVLKIINSPVNPNVDKHWQLVSNTMAPVSFATPLAMYITGWAINDELLRKKSYYTAASSLVAAGLSTALKFTFKEPRPYEKYPDIITKKGEGGSYSFPSGHTTMAFATATSLSLSFPKWYVVIPSFGYATLVAYSRMYLGVHYLSDILGGIFLGIGTSFLVFKSEQWLKIK